MSSNSRHKEIRSEQKLDEKQNQLQYDSPEDTFVKR